jgi:hypothetical protein
VTDVLVVPVKGLEVVEDIAVRLVKVVDSEVEKDVVD